MYCIIEYCVGYKDFRTFIQLEFYHLVRGFISECSIITAEKLKNPATDAEITLDFGGFHHLV